MTRPQPLSDPEVPPAGRLLLRGGTVCTMDPAVPDLVGDVLVESGRIVAVGRDLPADAAHVIDCAGTIITPGFVNSHVHLFTTAMRGYWGEAVSLDMRQQTRQGTGAIWHHKTPDDLYLANLAGALEHLESGVTTLVDMSQSAYSPEHSDAAVSALLDSGARAVFVYTSAVGDLPHPERAVFPHDLDRLHNSWFSSSDGRVTLALNPELNIEAWRAGRHRDLPICLHVNNQEMGDRLIEIAAEGLVRDDTFVHCNGLADTTWDLIVERGGTISVSTIRERLTEPS